MRAGNIILTRSLEPFHCTGILNTLKTFHTCWIIDCWVQNVCFDLDFRSGLCELAADFSKYLYTCSQSNRKQHKQAGLLEQVEENQQSAETSPQNYREIRNRRNISTFTANL